MGDVIRLNPAEFQRLSEDIPLQSQKVKSIVDEANGAVTGMHFTGQAAESFKTIWRQDRELLEELIVELNQWAANCRERIDPAKIVSADFNP